MWQAKTGRTVPWKLQQACFKRDRWCCTQCGFHARPNRGELHADHIKNLATGGEDTLENLQSLCTACHAAKTRTEQAAGRARRKQRLTRTRIHPADALR